MKVLCLCSWYPNKLKPFDGDFLQRHARAISILHDVHTIFVKKDEAAVLTGSVLNETSRSGNLTETIIYYKPPETGIRMLDKLISELRYRKLFKEAVKTYISEIGRPDIVHVQIAMKAGRIALWMKKKYGIPYIVSEQWTGYLPESKPGLKDRNRFYISTCGKILEEAAKITTVSQTLADAIAKWFPVKNFRVIHNVVDTSIFFPVKTNPSNVTRFIHISTMTYQKNLEQMLEACRLLSGTERFSLKIFTPDPQRCHQLVKEYQLGDFVEISAEVPQPILTKHIQESDALILYSRYETFGCVVIEANACGIPAILSDLPVFREYSVENKTALYARLDDLEHLAAVLKEFISTKSSYNKEEIAAYTHSRYNFEIVAKQFDKVYQE